MVGLIAVVVGFSVTIGGNLDGTTDRPRAYARARGR